MASAPMYMVAEESGTLKLLLFLMRKVSPLRYLTRNRKQIICPAQVACGIEVPFIATVSTDHKWVVASFTQTTGNVWSNPELTCQHVDRQIPLAVGASAAMETKLLVFQGSLHDVLKKVDSQRQSLR